MHPDAQIRYVKWQIKQKVEPCFSAYQQLIHMADSLLAKNQNALENFSVPGFYFKPEEHKQNSLSLSGDAFAAYASALAYRLSGDKKYGAKACYFLNAWASVNKRCSDVDGQLVLTYNGTALLIAAELMSKSRIWNKKDINQFKRWVTEVYQPTVKSIRVRKNNWGDWSRFGSLLCASFLDDEKEINVNTQLLKSDLEQKIASDGRMIEEIKREKNGIWYTYFSLAPITASCWIIYNSTGENLFQSEKEGKLIKSALDYLCYYSKNPDEWKWFSHPRSGENEPWPENLFEAMNGIYEEKNYLDFVQSLRPVIYPFHAYAWTFPTLMPLQITPYQTK
jgi:Alginate lyase.